MISNLPLVRRSLVLVDVISIKNLANSPFSRYGNRDSCGDVLGIAMETFWR